MELQAFICENFELIVKELESSGGKLAPNPAFGGPSRELLRTILDGIKAGQQGLEEAVLDQNPEMFKAKIAEHGAQRKQAGFDLDQIIGEFRILRGRILAMWRNSGDVGTPDTVLEQVNVFNKIVDHALSESVQLYVGNIAASRDMFLAVLAHDLRSPLHGIAVANSILVSDVLPEEVRIQAAKRCMRATKIMDGLITDFLQFTRSRLQGGIPAVLVMCDLAQACSEALDVVKACEPDRDFVYRSSGNTHVHADYARMRQVLCNLLNNAVQHGDEDTPIVLTSVGEQDAVILSVTNSGKPITVEAARMIFEPFVQVPITTYDINRREKGSLGLGLFIAREIVRSHQGTVTVQSSADGNTVFTVRLPRTKALS